jgi:diguanylate cyclase (GGDEF)-like protein
MSVDEMLPLRTASPGIGWQAFLAAANRGERTQLPPDAVLDSPRTGPLAIEGSVSPLRAAGRLPPSDPATACTDPSAGAVLVLRDTTEARRASSEVLHRATHDALTGLVNRAEFERRLRQLLATAHAGHAHHCALFIDLDQFKIVNDSCGHAAGDRLLQQVARMLQTSVRSLDTVARMGGDEFAILAESDDVEGALALARVLIDAVDQPARFGDAEIQVGAAVGVAMSPDNGQIGEDLLRAADLALLSAKGAPSAGAPSQPRSWSPKRALACRPSTRASWALLPSSGWASSGRW